MWYSYNIIWQINVFKSYSMILKGKNIRPIAEKVHDYIFKDSFDKLYPVLSAYIFENSSTAQLLTI